MGKSSHNKISSYLKLALVSSFVIATIGCGNAKTIGGAQGASNVDAEVPEMNEINSKIDAADLEVLNVDQQLAALDLQNPLNLLGDNLKDSVKKLSGALTDLKAKIEEVKLKINEQISKLDANDPQQQKIIAKLQDALKYLDEVSGKIDEVIAKVEAKVDALFAKLEKKLEERLSGIQAILAKLALDKLKDSVLKNLIGG